MTHLLQELREGDEVGGAGVVELSRQFVGGVLRTARGAHRAWARTSQRQRARDELSPSTPKRRVRGRRVCTEGGDGVDGDRVLQDVRRKQAHHVALPHPVFMETGRHLNQLIIY
jgi:hypothetical protein